MDVWCCFELRLDIRNVDLRLQVQDLQSAIIELDLDEAVAALPFFPHKGKSQKYHLKPVLSQALEVDS